MADFDNAIIAIGKCTSVMRDEAQRLESMRVELAYIHDHTMPDGSHRTVTIPAN